MSASEIADNKWEVDASKPKLTQPASIAQIVMMGGFAAFFAYIIIFSLVGMFSEKKESDLADKYSKMGAGTEEAAPAKEGE